MLNDSVKAIYLVTPLAGGVTGQIKRVIRYVRDEVLSSSHFKKVRSKNEKFKSI